MQMNKHVDPVEAAYGEFEARNLDMIKDLRRSLTDEECTELATEIAAKYGVDFQWDDMVVFSAKTH
jgi:hypothetical protein